MKKGDRRRKWAAGAEARVLQALTLRLPQILVKLELALLLMSWSIIDNTLWRAETCAFTALSQAHAAVKLFPALIREVYAGKVYVCKAKHRRARTVNTGCRSNPILLVVQHQPHVSAPAPSKSRRS